jgi:O-methyltransferase involved in polyketide biosynthesis
MNNSIKIELGELQKTLLLPLLGRVMEFDNNNPLVKDKYAHEMIKKLEIDLNLIHNMPALLQINSSIRAYNFDNAILRLIVTYPDATIINIGAGLDTTFQRVDNRKIFWYDLDLEDTIELRRRLIPETERNKFIAKSVFDRSWFNDIKVRGAKIFFIAAGVLAYFKEEKIKPLLLDIIKEFPQSEMEFEIYSKIFLWLNNRAGKKKDDAMKITGKIQWAPNSARSIAEWDTHISIIDEYPFYSKVKLESHWDKKYLSPIRMIRLINGIRMVHLKFS